jgi:predicted dehydrogenase
MKTTHIDRREFIRVSSAATAGLTMTSVLHGQTQGANDRLRIGVIGCGIRGNYLISEIFRLTDLNVEVAAICDVWKVNLAKTAATVAARQGKPPAAFARYADLLAVKDLDAVMIATPDFGHTPIMIDAIKLKKDVFVEKPMATDLEQAKTAMALARQHKTIVQVGSQRRSDRRHQAGAKLIQSGILGKISEVETAWHDSVPRWARAYDDVRPEDVDWEQYLMGLPKEPFSAVRFRRWHFFKDFTLGTPSLLGSHLIDVALWFMDDPLPSSAVAHGGVYVWKDGREHADTLDCILECPKGFIVNYSSRLSNKHAVPEAIFYGTKGTFDTESWTARGEGGGADALKEPVTVPKPAARSNSSPSAVPAADGQTAEPQNDPRIGGEGHVRNWIECVRSRATPNAPVEVGFSHSLAGILCFKALESGRRQIYDPKTMQIQAG